MPDRIRESIFGMLGLRVRDAAVVDLFAGSGSMGFEALSRGAASALFVDKDRLAGSAIEKNIETLRCADRGRLVMGDALGMSIIARCPWPTDLIILDPPYPLITEALGWARVKAQCAELVQLLADDGFLIVRTPNPFMVSVEASGGESAPVPERRIDTPRFARKKKYQRDRVRWEDETSTSTKGSMRKGSARAPASGPHGQDAPKRGTKPGARPAARPEPSELDDMLNEEGELIGGVLAGEAGGEGAEGVERLDQDDGVRVAFTAGPGAATAAGVLAAAAVPPVPGDLSIPGAIGPETHVYGSCAVHWYQRRREGGA